MFLILQASRAIASRLVKAVENPIETAGVWQVLAASFINCERLTRIWCSETSGIVSSFHLKKIEEIQKH